MTRGKAAKGSEEEVVCPLVRQPLPEGAKATSAARHTSIEDDDTMRSAIVSRETAPAVQVTFVETRGIEPLTPALQRCLQLRAATLISTLLDAE
ncbi:hypothetical protein JCM33774_40510 [Actinophytocola sp. KF-1]